MNAKIKFRWNRVALGWYCLNVQSTNGWIAIEVLRDAKTDPWKIVAKHYVAGQDGPRYVFEGTVETLTKAKATGVALVSEYQ